ncbi:hypothetical protein [Methylococcus sp. EFPC2]|uniref:hypothetical protein n=1 Tax=Methylococcus sp. EFPC2 TaxID=2812648 RepID=UPI0019682753|nr:hypothetical protein [Methylococcus sp. EFPC2]QSA97949.1 hypothetical protein JWZ97_03730 [Methylococcus sp. EFPC2]
MIKYITFGPNDKKLWIGIGVVSAILIVLLSVFATTSPFYWVERFVITLFEVFLPGYVIVKLFLDHVSFSESPVVDKVILSFGISFATVQTLYFLFTYVRTYALNVDEDVISSNAIAIILALLVSGGAYGIRFYQDKKQSQAGAGEAKSDTE